MTMTKRLSFALASWDVELEDLRHWHNVQRKQWPSFMLDSYDRHHERRVNIARTEALRIMGILSVPDPSLAEIANESMRHSSGLYL